MLAARLATNSLFIMNSACGATLVTGRLPSEVTASPKSNKLSSVGRLARRNGRYTMRRVEVVGSMLKREFEFSRSVPNPDCSVPPIA